MPLLLALLVLHLLRPGSRDRASARARRMKRESERVFFLAAVVDFVVPTTHETITT